MGLETPGCSGRWDPSCTHPCSCLGSCEERNPRGARGGRWKEKAGSELRKGAGSAWGGGRESREEWWLFGEGEMMGGILLFSPGRSRVKQQSIEEALYYFKYIYFCSGSSPQKLKVQACSRGRICRRFLPGCAGVSSDFMNGLNFAKQMGKIVALRSLRHFFTHFQSDALYPTHTQNACVSRNAGCLSAWLKIAPDLPSPAGAPGTSLHLNHYQSPWG